MQPWKCVTFYYNITLDCSSEHGEFSFEIEIRRWKLDGFLLEEIQEFLSAFSDIYNEID